MLRRSARNAMDNLLSSSVGRKEMLDVCRGDIKDGAGEASKEERPARVKALAALDDQSSVSDVDENDTSYTGIGAPFGRAGQWPPQRRTSEVAEQEPDDSDDTATEVDGHSQALVQDNMSQLSELTPSPPSPTVTGLSSKALVFDRPPPLSLSGAPSFVMQPGGFFHIQPNPRAISPLLTWWQKLFFWVCAFPVLVVALITLCGASRDSYVEFNKMSQDSADIVNKTLHAIVDGAVLPAHIGADIVAWSVRHAAKFAVIAIAGGIFKAYTTFGN
ncbi:hypothetical protein EXIGLDRAFT_768235 [Exidia glandulosa HHB12029]|uniref:Uncharacterized protein n=1 Tax=Exidia glandulosa HHB12029 TaxID=1314781 RepID=A0A165ICR1_EXIGL|nr:hypothetical protein EXIGLDRAFT_768235 [Exidia glandulosa HHB12029]